MKASRFKRNVLICSMSLLAILSATGAISGTIAWYQYSTKSNAYAVVTDGSCTKNLQMYIGDSSDTVSEDDWKSDFVFKDIATYIKENTEITSPGDIKPVSNYVTKDDGALSGVTKDSKLGDFYSMPRYQDVRLAKADASEYVQFPLTFRMYDVKNKGYSSTSHDLYLENIVISSKKDVDENDKNDYSKLADAVRVHFSSKIDEDDTNTLVSIQGQEINDFGNLDLNGDDKYDKPLGTYEFSDETDDLIYGVDGAKETSYSISDMIPQKDDYGKYTADTGHCVGRIPANGVLTVTVTIYLDGWQTFTTGEGDEAKTSSIWDGSLKGTTYNVGMTFGVDYIA